METLLVTGAAGTVGNYVVSLAEAAGYRVIASDRVASGIRVPVRGEVRVGDLRDAAFVGRVVQGCDHVIHTAAQLDVAAESSELAQVNTEAVALLYEAAEAAGVRRFVHTSTALLYDVGRIEPVTEQSPVAPRGSHGLSKHGAELFLRGKSQTKGPGWTIVRAAPIYGRRGRHFAASLLAVGPILSMWLPRLPRLHGGPLTTLVHAEDVASALLFVLKEDVAVGQIFNASDGDAMALGDRLTFSFQAYGLKTWPSVSLSRGLTELGVKVLQVPGYYQSIDASVLALWKAVRVKHHLKPSLRPRLDREALALLYNNLIVDNSRLRSLGWAPRYANFEQGWRDVLRWYQAERWVPRYH